MSITEKNKWIIAVAIVLPILSAFVFFLSLPSSTTLTDELEMIPANAYLHCHISSSFDIALLSYLPSLPDNSPSAEYIADILADGPASISITGMDLFNLTPQYLILTRYIGMDDMQTRFMSFHSASAVSAVQTGNRVDILTDGGSIVASITEMQGWTAVFMGSGSNAAAESWLSLEKEKSLAADSVITLLADFPGDFSLVVTNTTLELFNIIPIFLSARENQMLEPLISVIDRFAVHALIFNVNMQQDSDTFELSLTIGHNNHTKTTFSCTLDRTNFSPDSLLSLISNSNDFIR